MSVKLNQLPNDRAYFRGKVLLEDDGEELWGRFVALREAHRKRIAADNPFLTPLNVTNQAWYAAMCHEPFDRIQQQGGLIGVRN